MGGIGKFKIICLNKNNKVKTENLAETKLHYMHTLNFINFLHALVLTFRTNCQNPQKQVKRV